MLVDVLAETSKKLILKLLASSSPSSYETLRLSSMSHLFPINNLFTFSYAYLLAWGYIIELLINFIHPSFHGFETFSISNIIYYDYSMSSSVVTAGYGTKSILSGSIPYLQLYLFLIQCNGFYFLYI